MNGKVMSQHPVDSMSTNRVEINGSDARMDPDAGEENGMKIPTAESEFIANGLLRIRNNTEDRRTKRAKRGKRKEREAKGTRKRGTYRAE
jgi:hypothetical protein